MPKHDKNLPNKLSINLSNEALAFVKQIAEERGITLTAAVKEALSTYKFIVTAISEGNDIILRNGSVEQKVKFVFHD